MAELTERLMQKKLRECSVAVVGFIYLGCNNLFEE